MSIAPARNPDILALAPVFDITAALPLKDALVEALSLRTGLVLDGANVERVGTPAVQVLLAASRGLAANSQRLVLINPSPVLRGAFDDLGLAAELECWSKS